MRDHRDLVIEQLSHDLAEMTETASVYRTMVQAALQEHARLISELRRLTVRYHALLDERRASAKLESAA